MWGAALHDKNFVRKMLSHVKDNKESFSTSPRMIGMLTVISEVRCCLKFSFARIFQLTKGDFRNWTFLSIGL